MPELINVNGLTKIYGARHVLEDVSLSINAGDRIGIVGSNGQGKSTLLNIMMGNDTDYLGTVLVNSNVRMAHLRQNFDYSRTTTIRTMADMKSTGYEKKKIELEEKMGLPEYYNDERKFNALIEEYTALTSQQSGGINKDLYFRILEEFDMPEKEMDKPVCTLSGGQKTKAGISRVLATNADVMAMDEPTNHLDIEGRQFLEDYISQLKSALILISHDRVFLDNTTNRIFEVSNGDVNRYTGNYSQFDKEKKTRFARAMQVHSTQSRQFEKMKETEQLLLKITKINPDKSRGSALRNYRKRMERFERQMVEKPQKERSINMKIKSGDRRSGYIYSAVDMSVGYGDVPILSGLDIDICRGDKIALTGPNGHGKTSLIKTMLGEIKPMSGEQKMSSVATIGYHDQEHESLNYRNTIFEEIQNTFPDMKEEQIRPALARMLFRGDDIYKKIGHLSNGERSRVILSKLVIKKPDILILDEPTNNLDIASSDKLIEVLKSYEDTILLISHDRFLIDALCSSVWYLADGSITAFAGNYEEFMNSLE